MRVVLFGLVVVHIDYRQKATDRQTAGRKLITSAARELEAVPRRRGLLASSSFYFIYQQRAAPLIRLISKKNS